MGTIGYILLCALFAAAAALLYVWGLAKQRDERNTLTAMLYGKCEKRVRRYLKSHDRITERETAALIDGASVKLVYSKTRFGVTDAVAFSRSLLERMEKAGRIRRAPDGAGYQWNKR